MSACWINGSLVDAEAARISVFDHAVLVGDGIFETMQVLRGRPFALTRHLARLGRSAAGLGLEPPADDLIRGGIEAALGADRDAGRLRITLSSGAGPLGSGRGTDDHTLIIATGPASTWAATSAVITVDWTRNERAATAGLKTTSYADNVIALRAAEDAGADEAIFANTVGNLCEGTGTNVFIVIDDHLVTPPLSSGCLAGVTRALVLELTNADEIDVPLSALAGADEAFLTSSTRDVMPIAVVNGRALPATPGRHTKRAQTAFAELSATNLDP